MQRLMKKILLLIFVFAFVGFLNAQDNDQNNNKTQQNPMLSQPITVTIGGDFIITGSFTASKYQRLDHFITTLYTQAQLNALSGLTQLETIKQVSKEVKRYALRNITLKHVDGSVQKIDLLKFRLTGDLSNSPYLKSDDVIIFPAYDEEKNIIDISGAVNKPTKFQFVEGDKLSDAILFAGGLNKDAYDNIEYAEISRLDKTGNKESLFKVKISDDFVLKSNDRIRILADENQKKDYKVLVLGEVKFPGFVYVKKDSSTLSEVIEKAGGFKSNADLRNSEVIRDFNSIEMLKKYQLTEDYLANPDKLLLPETQLRMRQQREVLEMMRTSNLTEEDSLFFSIDNQLRVLKSESLVDFTKLSDPNSEESKFIVKEGDLVLVPDKFDYVYVFGQVSKAGYVKYNPESDYKYYIQKSGGKTQEAKDDDEVVVIKGKGKDWVTEQKEKIKIEPGDYVYVPKEIPRTTWFYVARTSAVVGIVGSIATIVLLLVQFGK